MRITHFFTAITSGLLFLVLTACNNGSNTTTISLNSSSYSLTQGSSTTLTVSNSGSMQANSITVSNLPSGVTASGCTSIAASASCTLTLTATSTATTGSSTLTVQGSNTNAASASLTVTANISGLTSLNGPEGGAAASGLASTSTTLYLGTPGAGVFTASTSGSPLSWSAINTGLTNTVINALTTDSSGNVYVGTSTGVFELASGSSTWSAKTTSGLGNNDISALAVDNTGDIFVIGNPAGNIASPILYELEHGTTSWVNLGSTDPILLANSPNGEVIYSDASNNVSAWTGTSFTNTGFSSGSVGSIAVDNNDNIYVGSAGTVYKGTFSAGPSWTYASLIGGTALPSDTFNNIAVDSSNNVYIGSSNEVFNWNGSAWAQFISTWKGSPISALTTVSTTPYVGTTNGILVPNGGNTAWNVENNGLNAGNTYPLLFNNNTLYAGYQLPLPTGEQAALVSYYNNGHWTAGGNFGAGNYAAAALALQNNTLFAGTVNGVYSSTDATSWAPAGSGAPAGVTTLLTNDTGTTTTLVAYQASPAQVYEKTLSGSWVVFGASAPANAQAMLSVNGTVYLGNDTGLSSSTGGPWFLVTGAPVGSITALATDSSHNIYIAGPVGSAHNDVCKLSGGTCTSLTPSNPLNLEADSLLFVGNTLYAGTTQGLYSWTASATSWTQVGLDGIAVHSLTSDSSNNLYIGTTAGTYILPSS